MNFYLFLEEIIVVLINIFGILLGFLVFNKNKKEKLNQVFALMTFFLILWIDFAFLGNRTENEFLAIIFYRLNGASVAITLSTAYFFYISYFLKKRYFILEKIILFLGFLSVFISIFTPFEIRGIIQKEWGNDIIFGSFHIFLILYYIFITFIIIFFLLKSYFSLPQTEKLKIQYFFVGTLLVALFNVIFNVVLSSVLGSTVFQHFGDYSAIFFLVFTGYAIAKRELFEIKVVWTAVLVGLIAILLFIDIIFFTNQRWLQIGKGITFCLFLIFGRSLILSVIHEISLREKLEKAYEELKKLDTAKSEFISMASHQLRTPLSAIKGYISMIIEGSYGQIPELVKEKLQNVFTSNERLIQIVNTLLDISKIDLGKMEIKKEPVQIEEIIQSCYDDLKIEAQKKGLNFVFEKPETPLPKINADPLRIRQVFMNLIDNAIKYTPKGEIKMTVSQKGNSILFLIKDSGAGLTEKEKKEIFQSFTRGSAGLDYFIEGTGLGLSIAKKITELHQGKIWAESEGKDKGSTFFVELPIQ
jgi:signal transduction histidine kinase